MENSLTQLERKYNEIMEIDYTIDTREKFGRAVAEYLLFIKSASPFNNFIALGIGHFYIKGLFKQLNEAINKNQGILPHVMPFAFGHKSSIKSPLFIFHQNLVGKAKELGMTSKKTVIIFDRKDKQGLYIEDEPSKIYQFKKLNSDRLAIILNLISSKQPLSALEVLGSLGKKDDVENSNVGNIKEQISDINIIFKKKLEVQYDLIVITKSGIKNLYFLNNTNYLLKIES